MTYSFSKETSSVQELVHAYSYRFDPALPFVQQDNYIAPPPCSAYRDGYASVSLLTLDKFAPGVTISTECSFEDIAAPLILIAEDTIAEKDGIIRYNNYFEVVLYKGGINVWRLWSENGSIVHKNILRLAFPVETGRKHLLTVKVNTDSIAVESNGIKATIPVSDMFRSFYAGITGCEGICRFYTMSITE